MRVEKQSRAQDRTNTCHRDERKMSPSRSVQTHKQTQNYDVGDDAENAIGMPANFELGCEATATQPLLLPHGTGSFKICPALSTPAASSPPNATNEAAIGSETPKCFRSSFSLFTDIFQVPSLKDSCCSLFRSIFDACLTHQNRKRSVATPKCHQTTPRQRARKSHEQRPAYPARLRFFNGTLESDNLDIG